MSDLGLSSDAVERGVAEVSRNSDVAWSLGQRFRGGVQEGAWRVVGGSGERAVLKVWPDGYELDDAAEAVAAARARGWPTPEWYSWRSRPPAYVLQQLIPGRAPEVVTQVLVADVVRVLTGQREIGCDRGRDWSAFAWSVVFEDPDGTQAAVRSHSAAGAAAMEAIARRGDLLAQVTLASGELVHGDLDTDNLLVDNHGHLAAMIDTQDLGRGTAAIDAGRFLNGCWLWGATGDAKKMALNELRALFGLDALALASIANILTVLAFIIRHEDDDIDACCHLFTELLDALS